MQEEEFIEEENKIKPIILYALALILIILMVSYTILNYGNKEIILGMFDSTTIDNNIIKTDNFTIEIQPEIYEDLIYTYLKNEGKEIKACLLGYKNDSYYKINDILYPKIIEQKFDEIITKPCSGNTLVIIHSHPNRRCLPSEQDLKTKKMYKQETLAAIMCEKGRFNFYN